MLVLEPDSTPGRRMYGNCYHSGMAQSANGSLSRDLKTVFLDRDGILNEKMAEGRYVTSWSDLRLLTGAAEAVGRLNRAGLRVVVVSNQRGIALGLYTADDVRAIHSAFQKLLKAHGAAVDGFFFCPHDKAQCNCRKPLAGLFEQAVAEFPEITGRNQRSNWGLVDRYRVWPTTGNAGCVHRRRLGALQARQ